MSDSLRNEQTIERDLAGAWALRLRGYAKMTPDALRHWLGQSLGAALGWTPGEPEALLAEASTRKIRLPAMALPVGMCENRVLALDMSYSANERGLLPVISAAPGEYWRLDARDPAGYFRREPPTDDDRIALSFDGAARAALATLDPQERASRLCLALTKPMYTAANLEQVDAVAIQLVLDSQSLGTDPHALRIARAWPHPEALRLVAAERAIAGRVREAVVGLEAALWMGANATLSFRVLEKMYNRMGWGWNSRWLQVVRQHFGA